MSGRFLGQGRPLNDADAISASIPTTQRIARGAVPLDFRYLLERLCDAAKLPKEDWSTVIDAQALVLHDIALQFQVEKWSGFVKVFALAGVPAPNAAEPLFRLLLARQLTMPAPFCMVAGLDSRTGNLHLVGCAPLPLTDSEIDHFFDFLFTCIDAVESIQRFLEKEPEG